MSKSEVGSEDNSVEIVETNADVKARQLKALETFCQKTWERYCNEKPGRNDNTVCAFRISLNSFYHDATAILNNDGMGVLAKRQGLTNSAKSHFKHRNNIMRGVADVAMVLSIVGLLVALARVAQEHTFFFSTAPTKRETFLKGLMQGNIDNGDVFDPMCAR